MVHSTLLPGDEDRIRRFLGLQYPDRMAVNASVRCMRARWARIVAGVSVRQLRARELWA